MSAPEGLAQRLASVRARIDEAARRAGRSPDEVTLVAVSKTFGPDVVKQAIELGVKDLGENRAQELKQKVAVLGRGPTWHFVGHLQTNKVKQVAGLAALIHSVDRFGLAEALDRRAASLGIVQRVLLEVNVSGERTKHGVEPSGLTSLAEQVGALPHLKVSGLMTMAPFADEAEASRPYFADLRLLRDELRGTLAGATHLSMGMTRDMEVAIEEGATLVRVGEAIFGPRRPAA